MKNPARRCLPVALASLAALGCDPSPDPFVGPDEPGIEASRLTNRTLSQTDHFGLPAINTVFVPSAEKDRYNRLAPATDPAFVDEIRGFIAGFLTAVGPLRVSPLFTPEQLAGVLYPDVQPLDFPDAVLATGGPLSGFPDGRDFDDDVIDTELFLIFGENGDLNSDGVDANDKARLAEFPYLPGPHTAP